MTTRLQAELPTEKDDCIELKKHLEDLGDHVHGGKGGREGGREGREGWEGGVGGVESSLFLCER